jgi:hypothetical protein
MAFLRPANLIPVTFNYNGSLDNLTDHRLGFFHFDAKVFYIDVIPHDANATFDETLVTLEWEDGDGDDTAIDAITIAAQAGTHVVTSVDYDGLSSNAVIPASSDLLMTVANVSTGADLGVTIIFWVENVDNG